MASLDVLLKDLQFSCVSGNPSARHEGSFDLADMTGSLRKPADLLQKWEFRWREHRE